MFFIEFSRKAEKALTSLPKEVSKRIVIAVEKLQKEQFPKGAIKLKGFDKVFRIRVGDYRILYEIYPDKNLILIINIDKRSRVYESI